MQDAGSRANRGELTNRVNKAQSPGNSARTAFVGTRVVFLRSALMTLSFFSSQGWESWDIERRPLIPERMPVLIDDDLRFEDGPAAPRS